MALTESFPRSDRIVSHSLTIETGPALETCLVRLEGELDSASADALTEHLLRLLASDLQSVVVDLDGLEFIDSTGLQALLTATRRARGTRDHLRIIEPEGQVSRVFKLTNINALLPIIPR
jgi:anti-sigma B factor antagonist